MSRDLKLLIDLAWANRDGQVDFYIPRGFAQAANRLWRLGLVGLDEAGNRIALTRRGEELVDKFDRKARP